MPGIVAAFHELDTLIDAIHALKKERGVEVDVYSPTIRHEIEHAVEPPLSGVRKFTLTGGLLGASFGYWVAIWTSDYWPLVVGGKAVASWIPYTIIAFEMMVLVGALSTVAGMFILSRVPKVTTTVGFDPRFTGANFGVYVEAPPERLQPIAQQLRDLGATEVHDAR
jgi:hypothetical protein